MKKTITTLVLLLLLTSNLFAQNWEYCEIIPERYYNKVYAIGVDTAFLIEEEGTVVRSLDGFKSIHDTQRLKGFPSLRGIDFRNSQEGIIVGGRSIFRTLNGGNNWQLIYTHPSVLFTAVSVTSTHVWVVGTSGTVLQSADFGDSWTPILIPKVNVLLNGISFNDKGYGMITGTKFTRITTTDAGTTWEIAQNENAGIDYYDSYVQPHVGDSIGIYSHYNGDDEYFYYNFNQKSTQISKTESGDVRFANGLYLLNDTTVITGEWCWSTCGPGCGAFFSSMDKWDQNKPINFKFLDFSVGPDYIGLAKKITSQSSVSFGNESVGYLTQHGKVFRIVLK